MPLVHIGDAEYFDGVARALRGPAGSCALVECITREANTRRDASRPALRTLRVPVGASDEQRALARAHGMLPQMDAIDLFARAGASHDEEDGFRVYVADASSEELNALPGGAGLPPRTGPLGEVARQLVHGRRRGGRRAPGAAALFLERAAAYGLRAAALFAPCPELSLVLLDWARAGGLGRPSASLWPLLAAVARLDLRAARKMAFAMTLVGGHADAEGGAADAIAYRNAIAVEAVRESLAGGAPREVRLLYGALHLPDLERRLHAALRVARSSPTPWRTVWRADASAPVTDLLRARLGLLGFPAYLLLGALDYASTVAAAADAGAAPAAAAALALYVGRRALFYYAFSRWLFEWDRGAFGASVD